jgi:Fe-S-cluster containining protein
MKEKIKRLFTCFLPVARNRRGSCQNCGACCRLPWPCLFLKQDDQGRSRCAIYPIRPPNCRKYPRTAMEFLTASTCGFKFVNDESYPDRRQEPLELPGYATDPVLARAERIPQS